MATDVDARTAERSAPLEAQPPHPPTGPGRLGSINGLRGLAIVAVVGFHLIYHLFKPGVYRFDVAGFPILPATFITNGWLGVNLFFLLSGFVLYLPYATGKRRMSTRADVIGFYKHRYRRLMPLYYFSVAIGLIFLNRDDVLSPVYWKYAAAMATATFPLFIGFFTPKHNLVLWTLGVEIWFSIVFPLVIAAVTRWGVYRVAAAVLVLGLAVRHVGILDRYYVHGWAINWVKDNLPGRLDDFLVGMVACRLYLDRRRAVVAWRGPALAAAAVLLTATCYLWECHMIGLVPRSGVPFFNNLAQAGFFCLILGALGLDASPWRRAFDNAPLQVLGMMCYSLYIWHVLVQDSIWPGGKPVIDARVVPYLLLLAVVSILSYRYIEFGSERDWRKLFRPAS